MGKIKIFWEINFLCALILPFVASKISLKSKYDQLLN